MSKFDGYYPRYSGTTPRTTRGGIKAQSTRGDFGKSWWARRWIGVLESFDIGARLTRGRSYARKGQVVSIDVKEGLVKATVQGSRVKPYRVEIRVSTIEAQQWLKLSQTALSQAIVAAKLLAGEMPQDVEELFKTSGVSLLPDKLDDLKTDCSCPDWSNPCKHIAAVYYLLGEEFDRDPFLIFRLRGMDKQTLLQLISEAPRDSMTSNSGRKSPTRGSKKIADERGRQTTPAEEAAAPLRYQPLPIEAQAFWEVCEPSGNYHSSMKAPHVCASLPKRLGNLPFWRGSEKLVLALEKVYRLASEDAKKLLADEM